MSRKGENIFHRKDGRWEARYIKDRLMDGRYHYGYVYGKTYLEVKDRLIDGKYRYGYVYGKTYLEVKKKRNDILLNLERIKKESRNCKYTFNYYIDLWLNSIKFMVKKSTYAHYHSIVKNHIAKELGEIKISCLSSGIIESFINKKFESGRIDHKGGLSNKTVRDIVVVLRQILSYANININFKLPKLKKKQINILSKEEQKKLEQKIIELNSSYSIGILVSLYTGMRLGEICALKWENIDLKRKTIYVSNTMIRIQNIDEQNKAKTKVIIDQPKTEYSKREIPVNSFIYNILKDMYKENYEQKYFLTNSLRYIEPRTYYNKYKEIIKQAEISSYGFHALRHTFATRCIEVGMDPKTLSEILGHSDVKVTLSLYVHPSSQLKGKYIEMLTPIIKQKNISSK